MKMGFGGIAKGKKCFHDIVSYELSDIISGGNERLLNKVP